METTQCPDSEIPSPEFLTELAELGPVVQRMNDAIHWINRYPVNRYWQNKLLLVGCSLGSDLSGEQRMNGV